MIEWIKGLRHGSVRWTGAVLRLRTCWVSSYEPADAKGGNTVTTAIGMPTQLDQSLSLLPCFSPSISNLSPHVLLSSLHDHDQLPRSLSLPSSLILFIFLYLMSNVIAVRCNNSCVVECASRISGIYYYWQFFEIFFFIVLY